MYMIIFVVSTFEYQLVVGLVIYSLLTSMYVIIFVVPTCHDVLFRAPCILTSLYSEYLHCTLYKCNWSIVHLLE